ncbi:hypothetical protein ACFV0A_37620, partial [Streptomyces sp. NPDC059552]
PKPKPDQPKPDQPKPKPDQPKPKPDQPKPKPDQPGKGFAEDFQRRADEAFGNMQPGVPDPPNAPSPNPGWF